MGDATRSRATRATAVYRRELLSRPRPNRPTWQGHVARSRDDVISELAVAEVITQNHHSVRGRSGQSQMLLCHLQGVVLGLRKEFADKLDMRIEFNVQKLQASIRRAHRDGTDDVILQQEQMMLDSHNSMHCYVRSFGKTVVGFYWLSNDGDSRARI